MEQSEYQNIYNHEATHFFYVATHALVLSLVAEYVQTKTIDANSSRTKKNELQILDAGCGTGLLARKMQRFGKVRGVDFSLDALKFAKKRGVQCKRASIEKLPYKDASFDVVVSIDVLVSKSIRNDLVPLREFYRVLKPGGILILRVSANPWLQLAHDRHVHIGRRYSKQMLKEKLHKTRFGIQKLTHIHSPLFPLIVLRHFWEQLSKPDHHSTIGVVHPVINKLLTWVLHLENSIARKVSIPFGVGLVVVATKSKK